VRKNIPEGQGELGNDMEPDSLFLRYLGQDGDLARRYHIIYGQVLRGPGGFVLKTALIQLVQQLRPELLKLAEKHLGKGKISANVQPAFKEFTSPERMLDGDLAASVASA